MTGQMPERANFTYLTGALALLLFLIALADQFEIQLGQLVVQAGIVIVLALDVWSIKSKPRWLVTRIGFVAAIFLVTIGGLALEMAGMDLLWLGILLAYLLSTTWLCTQQVLFTGSVDLNKIVGAACIFLLLGLIWAILYMAIAEVIPEAFNGLASTHWYETFPDLVYFSFVSLTTLGYGDIGPVAPLARFLAFMEAIVGQFYVAIIVASLVGIRISNQPN
jgi:voltage-gated potassium channel